MPRKDRELFDLFNSYLGAQVPKHFFLRWQAMCRIRPENKRLLLAIAAEKEVMRWEALLDKREAQAYDTLLEISAREHNISVNDIKKPLEVEITKNPLWPKRRLRQIKTEIPPGFPRIKKV